MNPLVAKHLAGEEITVADTCATITSLEELTGYQEALLDRKALTGEAVLAIEARRAQLIARRT